MMTVDLCFGSCLNVMLVHIDSDMFAVSFVVFAMKFAG